MITVVDRVAGLNEEEYSEVFDRAARIFRRGGTVAFPTETVYGLGANALSERAVDKIFKAKGRPSDNPLIVHIGDMDRLDEMVTEIPDEARLLMEKFWPGPLTIVLNKKPIIPDVITAGLKTVAVRMPANKVALEMLDRAGLPIAAPSANLSGRPSPTNAFHVLDDLNGKIDMIIDGGSTEYGLESTVVDVANGGVSILRPGAVTVEMLEAVIGPVKISFADKDLVKHIVPASPGMKYTHYAPKGKLVIVAGEPQASAEKICGLARDASRKYKTGIMATDQTMAWYKEFEGAVTTGDRDDLRTVAARLFETFRKFDEMGMEMIYAESFPEDGIGLAIMNRLKKAAGYEIIDS